MLLCRLLLVVEEGAGELAAIRPAVGPLPVLLVVGELAHIPNANERYAVRCKNVRESMCSLGDLLYSAYLLPSAEVSTPLPCFLPPIHWPS